MTITKIARYHGAHRPDRAGKDFRDLYRDIKGRDFDPDIHHALHTSVSLCADLSKVFGVTVTPDPYFASAPCVWCPGDASKTRFRITAAQSRADLHVPIDQVEACGDCVETVVQHVRDEQDPECDRDIKIEVAV